MAIDNRLTKHPVSGNSIPYLIANNISGPGRASLYSFVFVWGGFCLFNMGHPVYCSRDNIGVSQNVCRSYRKIYVSVFFILIYFENLHFHSFANEEV
jgi:hypothetical protein